MTSQQGYQVQQAVSPADFNGTRSSSYPVVIFNSMKSSPNPGVSNMHAGHCNYLAMNEEPFAVHLTEPLGIRNLDEITETERLIKHFTLYREFTVLRSSTEAARHHSVDSAHWLFNSALSV